MKIPSVTSHYITKSNSDTLIPAGINSGTSTGSTINNCKTVPWNGHLIYNRYLWSPPSIINNQIANSKQAKNQAYKVLISPVVREIKVITTNFT